MSEASFTRGFDRRGRALGAACAALAALAMATAGSGGTDTTAGAQDPFCAGDIDAPRPKPGSPPLVMGIYPGGVAGQLGAPKAAKPEDPVRRLQALGLLRGDRQFAVHLYLRFSGDGSTDAANERVLLELEDHMRRGYLGEVVLTFRPVAKRGAPDVAEYVRFVRRMVRRLGPDPAFHAMQVTNEVNNKLAADSSDGAYPGALDALVEGVIAAKEEARGRGFDQLRVGFNWFYRLDPNTEQDFWSGIGARGGKAFTSALDWVGVDAYPGTFFPPTVQPGGERNSLVNAFSVLRECFEPLAGIAKTVPLHVSENGYPTGAGRSYEQQERSLRTMVGTVSELRRNYGVTDYRWFDLRDGDSSDPDFGQQYGLMRDDYTPKPAFGAYRELVARLCAPRPAGADGTGARRCVARRSRVRARGIAGVRVGSRRAAVRERLGRPARIGGRLDRYCVAGGGDLRVVYSPAGRVTLVATTASGHRSRGIGRGASRRALARAFPRIRRLGRGLLRAGRRSRVVFGVGRRRVRYVAVLGGRALPPRGPVRSELRRAGLRR